MQVIAVGWELTMAFKQAMTWISRSQVTATKVNNVAIKLKISKDQMTIAAVCDIVEIAS